MNPISTAYERGYLGAGRCDRKSANPYSEKDHPTMFYAWIAGWNDKDLGYDLELKQFEDPVTEVERLVKNGGSHNLIQQKTGCAPSTISRVAKRIGLSRENRKLKTHEINLLMSDKPIWEIAFKLNMSREQVSQHRYKQKKRCLNQNLNNLKFGE